MNCIEELEIKDIIRHALKEDIGVKDITSEWFIQKKQKVKAVFLVKEHCVVCGLGVAALVFKTLDKSISFEPFVSDGTYAKKGQVIAQVRGLAKNILTAERVALNFLSLLSGIATKTRQCVEMVKPYHVKILDTRKTIPGLRLLQKYAVRIGGGYNHRLRLDEMVMVKDNHLQVTTLEEVLSKIHLKHIKAHKIEIEVKNLKEFKEVLKRDPDIIMLDNMTAKDMKKAVALRNARNLHKPLLEASGGIDLHTIREVASIGVDVISIGALTHSVESADISLEIE